MNFGYIIKALKEGKAVQREGWNGKGMFVVKQNPCTLGEKIIPNMQNLPQSAKDILMARTNKEIHYNNQMLIIKTDGTADSWVPSSSDIFANDWVVLGETPSFITRMVDERNELADRLEKLHTALESDGFAEKVGTHQFILMTAQVDFMDKYLKVVDERLADLTSK